MNSLRERIKQEIRQTFPAVIYFFLAINLFNYTFGWIMREGGLRLISFPHTVIASVIIGKVILVADTLPFLNIFSDRPLAYGILWKTAIYSFFGFLFTMLERLAPLLFRHKDINIAWQDMLQSISLPRFCTEQVWMVILFLLFVVFHEVVKGVGKDKLRKLLFGR
jgi:hypothetical protein